MRFRVLLSCLVALAIGTMAGAANAKGCIKGAAAGAVAGHYAGHHAVAGAVGGCIVGRHLANKKAAEQRQHDELPKTEASSPT